MRSSVHRLCRAVAAATSPRACHHTDQVAAFATQYSQQGLLHHAALYQETGLLRGRCQSWRCLHSQYESAEARSRRKIADAGMYLVS